MSEPLPTTNAGLTLLSEDGRNCRLKCKCGHEFEVSRTRWKRRRLKSCGCDIKRIHESIVYSIFRR